MLSGDSLRTQWERSGRAGGKKRIEKVISLRANTAMSFFPVSVKESNGRNNYMINVGTNWSVAQVKEEILRQSDLHLNQFKLVFAGQELKDTMTLEVHLAGQ